MKKSIIISLCIASLSVHALDLGGIVSEGSKLLNKGGSTNLSGDYKTKGLKEALELGTKYAINTLGGEGFLKSSLVKIPLPKSLQSVASLASKVGGEKYVNDFVKTLNMAAGEAVPKTAPIFSKAIQSMSVKDATKLINGEKNSITSYFKTKTSTQLVEVVKPIVEKATASNDLTRYYTALVGASKGGSSLVDGELLSKAKGVASAFGVGEDTLPMSGEDLNTYVTRKTIDGMFTMIAKEEEKIRANPLSYSSGLIQKVFGK